MELLTNEQRLNNLKSNEFMFCSRVADHGIDKAKELSTLRPEMQPYVDEWFRRRRLFIIKSYVFSSRLSEFRAQMNEDFAGWSPKITINASYTIPSHADEMIKEGWTPYE